MKAEAHIEARRRCYMKKVRLGFRLIVLVAGATLVGGFLFGCGGQSSKQQDATRSDSSVKQANPADTCSLLSGKELADIVGNAVDNGRTFTSVEDCKWDTEDPSNVDVLLIAHTAGSIREQVLCSDLGKANNSGQRVTGLGDVAVWKFSSEGSLFNSGDLESCGPKGYVSLTLQGKRDEPTLKQAAINLATKVIERL
jgi:hypothetical protein